MTYHQIRRWFRHISHTWSKLDYEKISKKVLRLESGWHFIMVLEKNVIYDKKGNNPIKHENPNLTNSGNYSYPPPRSLVCRSQSIVAGKLGTALKGYYITNR